MKKENETKIKRITKKNSKERQFVHILGCTGNLRTKLAVIIYDNTIILYFYMDIQINKYYIQHNCS